MTDALSAMFSCYLLVVWKSVDKSMLSASTSMHPLSKIILSKAFELNKSTTNPSFLILSPSTYTTYYTEAWIYAHTTNMITGLLIRLVSVDWDFLFKCTFFVKYKFVLKLCEHLATRYASLTNRTLLVLFLMNIVRIGGLSTSVEISQ